MKDADPGSPHADGDGDSLHHLAFIIAKWAKCIASLLVLILFFLAVISGLLLLQLQTRDYGEYRMKDVGKVRDAADEDAFQDASGVHRVKRQLDPDHNPDHLINLEDVISTESAEVPTATVGDAIINTTPLHDQHAITEAILKEGFQNLTSKMDNILEKIETIPSLVDRWISLIMEEQGKECNVAPLSRYPPVEKP